MNDKNDIVIASCAELLEILDAPVADSVALQVRSVIDRDAAAVVLATRHAIFEGLSNAQRDSEAALAAFEENDTRTKAAEARATNAKPGNGFMGVVFVLCVSVCLGAEFALTLATLPYILGFQQWSVMGVALAIAPTTAVIIMDRVLGRLVEDPWEHIDTMTGHMRWLTIAVMTVSMLSLGVGNIWTVGLLADARERVTEMRHALEHKSAPPLSADQIKENRAATQKAILAVSIFVTLDGAMFSLFGLSELRRRRDYRDAHKRAATWREVHVLSRAKLLDSESGLRVAQRSWAEAEEHAQVAASRFREQQLLKLEQILHTAAPFRSGKEVVTSVLTAPSARGVRTNRQAA